MVLSLRVLHSTSKLQVSSKVIEFKIYTVRYWCGHGALAGQFDLPRPDLSNASTRLTLLIIFLRLVLETTLPSFTGSILMLTSPPPSPLRFPEIKQTNNERRVVCINLQRHWRGLSSNYPKSSHQPNLACLILFNFE